MANLTKLIEDYAWLVPDFPEDSPSETAKILASYEDTPFFEFSESEIEAELVANFKHLFTAKYDRWIEITAWWAVKWAKGQRDALVALACERLKADHHETPWIEEYLTRYFEEHKYEE